MSALPTALGYIRRGWSPVPVPLKQKGPTVKGWQNLRITAAEAGRFFNGKAQNIGVILGEASGGLVDADLDCTEAIALAGYFLPPTEAVFGRESKPRSHRLYVAPLPKRIELIDPENGECLLELRSTGSQTVFPGSIHPSGETVEWEEDGDPAQVDPGNLLTAVRKLGAACLLSRHDPQKGRHYYFRAVSGWLVRNGWRPEAVRHLLTPVARIKLGDRTDQADAEIRRLVEQADGKDLPGFPSLAEHIGDKRARKLAEWLEISVGRRGPEVREGNIPAENRPVLVIDPGNVERNVPLCEAALNAAPYERSVFQRGETVVVVGFTHDEEQVRLGRHGAKIPQGHAVLRRAEPEHVLYSLERGFQTVKHNRRGEPVRADVPARLAQVVLKNARFRPLLRVVRSPTMRADGSVLSTPGYDPTAALIYAPNAVFPVIPERPNQDEAKAALQRLAHPFRAIPFVGDEDKAVVLAEVITIVTRHLYAKAPGFMHRAAEAGTGKTLLADAASIIATGAPAANVAASVLADPAELRKLLTTWTLSATAVGLFDNADRGMVFNVPELNRFVTAETYGDRLLGSNAELLAPVVTVPIITGNQIDVRGDATRRFLIADLNAQVERPELRTFDFDLIEEVRRDRAELVVAALTILRAYAGAGFPVPEACANPIGSYEAWSRWVRHPLVWAGAADPVRALEKTRDTDEERVALGDVLARLRDAFGAERFTATLATRRAQDSEDLRNTLLGIARAKSGDVSAERLGRYLKANGGRVVGALRLVRSYDAHAKAAGYHVETDPAAGSCGGLRVVSYPTRESNSGAADAVSEKRECGSRENPPHPPATTRKPADGEWRDFGPPPGWADPEGEA